MRSVEDVMRTLAWSTELTPLVLHLCRMQLDHLYEDAWNSPTEWPMKYFCHYLQVTGETAIHA